ncbi:MAG: hypothetical protein LBV18_02190 [Alistipes sp.]|jgi:FKBP-type peptidyl-prolyl cis-trans isomerase|nr:hypothetical protein [Alistipes sp.]
MKKMIFASVVAMVSSLAATPSFAATATAAAPSLAISSLASPTIAPTVAPETAPTVAPETAPTVKSPKLVDRADSISYALGYLSGSTLYDEYPEVAGMLDMKIFDSALKDGARADRWLDGYALTEYVQSSLAAERRRLYAANIEAGERFLAENRLDPEVVETASGLQYRILTPGSGDDERPREYDDMTLTYTHKTLDGTTYDSGEDETTYPAAEIDGLTEGTMLMSPGAKYVFYIPASLAHGEESYDGPYGRVEPWSTVVCEVEMVTMTRDDNYYSEYGGEEAASEQIVEGSVRRAGDYTATVLASVSSEGISVSGYSSDAIVGVYEVDGLRIVVTGDKTIVLNGDGQEVFRATLDEENNNYDRYYLTEYRRGENSGEGSGDTAGGVSGDAPGNETAAENNPGETGLENSADEPVYLLLDMGFDSGSWYGAMLYVVENGVFSQPDGYIALKVGADNATLGPLSPVMDAYDCAEAEDSADRACVAFKAQTPYITYHSLTGSNLPNLTGDDLWYEYCDGELTKAGPAAGLGYFRERE